MKPNRTATVTGMVALVAAQALAQSASGPTRSEYTSFGMMSVTAGQTVRLNVVNTAIGDVRLPPGPCHVRLVFRDGEGAVLADFTQTLGAGRGTSLDLGDSVLAGRGAPRLQVWASVFSEVARPSGPELPPNPCLSTLEVFETDTGRTTLLHPGTMFRQQLSAPTEIVEERH